MRRFLLVLALAPWLLTQGVRGDDDAAKIVDSLFGDRIKAVQATATRTDDAALALPMLEAAKGSTASDAIRDALLEKAGELAMRESSGYATAVEIVKAWPVEGTAEQQLATMEKQLAIVNRIFLNGKSTDKSTAGPLVLDLLERIGDLHAQENRHKDSASSYLRAISLAPRISPDKLANLKAKQESAIHRERTARQIELLRTKLLENRDDTASAQALITLYLAEQGDAKSAAGYLDAAKDETLAKIVSLALRPVEELSDVDAMSLADWFYDAAKASTGPGQAGALLIAKKGYERVVAQPEGDNLLRTKAALQVKAVDERLEKLKVITPLAGHAASRSGSSVTFKLPGKETIVAFSFDRRTIQKRGNEQLVADLSGQRNDGLIEGAQSEKGVAGEAMSFDGMRQSIVVEPLVKALAGNHSALTMGTWIKHADVASEQFIFCAGRNNNASVCLILHPRSFWRFSLPEDAGPKPLTATTTVVPNQWYHLAVVWDGMEQKIYVNGRLENKLEATGFKLSPKTLTTTPGIAEEVQQEIARLGAQGKIYRRSERMFKGSLDEFFILSKAISDEDVAQLYEAGKKGISLDQLK